VDAAAAAEAFVQVTHATADRIIGGGRKEGIGAVRNARNYIFAAFMHLISRIAAKQGLTHTDYVDTDAWLAKWRFSDQGNFMQALESGVLCRELLNAMPPRARSVAIARYILGYSWEETAESLGTSINAAQKALSSGIRNAFGVCMRELKKMGRYRITEVENHLMNKKTRYRQKPRKSHERR
jgi:DNA-directed RNA polymerase specialized sigma24 family protein